MNSMLKMPKCPYCNEKDVIVLTSCGEFSFTEVKVIFACRGCKEQFIQIINFIVED